MIHTIRVQGPTKNDCEETLLKVLEDLSNEYRSVLIKKITYFPIDVSNEAQIDVSVETE